MRQRAPRRGILLVTAMFLALILFAVVGATVARVRSTSGFTQLDARRVQAALLARSALSLAYADLKGRDLANLPDGKVVSSGPQGEQLEVYSRLSPDKTSVLLRGVATLEGVTAQVEASVSLAREELNPTIYASRGWVGFNGQPALYAFDTSSAAALWKVLPPLPGLEARPSTVAMGVDPDGHPFVLMLDRAGPYLLRFVPDTRPAPADQQPGTWNVTRLPGLAPGAGTSFTVSGSEILAAGSNSVYGFRVDQSSAWELQARAPADVTSFTAAYKDKWGNLYAKVGVVDPAQANPFPGLPRSAAYTELRSYDSASASWQVLASNKPATGGIAPAPSRTPGSPPAIGQETYTGLGEVLTDGNLVVLRTSPTPGLSLGRGGSWSDVTPPGVSGMSVAKLSLDPAGGFFVQYSNMYVSKLLRYDPNKGWQTCAEPPAMIYDRANQSLIPMGNLAPNFGLMAAGGKPEKKSKFEVLWEF